MIITYNNTKIIRAMRLLNTRYYIWSDYMRPTKAVIDMSRLDKNIKYLKSMIIPDTEFMAVVKANAYGHGLYETARQAIESGATWLGVALPEEGAALRASGIDTNILVLGEIDQEQCEIVAKNNLAQTIASTNAADILNSIAGHTKTKVKIHIKLDTGMGRIGFRSWPGLLGLLKQLKYNENLIFDGVLTHFPTADDNDDCHTIEQIDYFNKMIELIKSENIMPRYIHAANSAALLKYPNAHYNLVRPGISMYGYLPSNKMNHTSSCLLPVLQWETKVTHINTVEDGGNVGYGKNYTAKGKIRVATLPVGYADGYNRKLGNNADVLIRKKRAPVIGTVCMDQMMVDITNVKDVEIGDKVVLLGEQGKECITADELADRCDTISYEILTSISDRVPRVFI